MFAIIVLIETMKLNHLIKPLPCHDSWLKLVQNHIDIKYIYKEFHQLFFDFPFEVFLMY
jgi:hypothetical protein